MPPPSPTTAGKEPCPWCKGTGEVPARNVTRYWSVGVTTVKLDRDYEVSLRTRFEEGDDCIRAVEWECSGIAPQPDEATRARILAMFEGGPWLGDFLWDQPSLNTR